MCVLLLSACLTDYSVKRVPNWLVVMGLLGGLTYRCHLQGGAPGLFWYMAGVLLPFCLAFPLYRRGLLGAGDVKLLAAAAGYLPGEAAAWWLVYTFLCGGILSLCRLVLFYDGRERIKLLWLYVRDCFVCHTKKTAVREGRTGEKLRICMAGPMLCSLLIHMGGIY